MQNNNLNRPVLFWHWASVIPKELCEYIIKNANWTNKQEGSFHSKKWLQTRSLCKKNRNSF